MTSASLTTQRSFLISQLEQGSSRQRLASRVFQALLEEFPQELGFPFPVGTIPLNIDTPTSDLDIVVEIASLEEGYELIQHSFRTRNGYRRYLKQDEQAIVCSFISETLQVEIFGQARPMEKQYAYRHMIVEQRLLELAGEPARRAIRELKLEGVKTEPAFARHFRIMGDPYEKLYELFDEPRENLAEIVAGVGYSP